MRRLFAFTPLIALAALPLVAQTVPGTINYQGRLTDNTPSQTPVTATVPMKFEIYDAASGGTQLWFEPASGGVNVAVTNGIFSVALGASVAIPPTVFTGSSSTRYLQITLNPGASQEVLSPRQLITANGYANLSQNANSAVSATTAATATNSTQLGGIAASGYLTTTATAYDSSRLGGTLASGWQKALAAPACPANQYLTTINPDGTKSCAAASYVETDPKVGSLSSGRVPYWNGASLANGTLYDSGAKLGIATTSPAAPLHVAGGNPASLGAGDGTGINPEAVAVQGRFAYVVEAGSNLIEVFDITNPVAIALTGSASTAAGPQAIAVQGKYAYVAATGANTLQVFDLTGANPVLAGSTATGAQPASVFVQGRYAYVVNSGANTLQVFDITNPAAIGAAVGSVATQAGPVAVVCQGRYAYVADYTANRLEVFDISNPPAIPAAVAYGSTDNGPDALFIQGRYLYMTTSGANSLMIWDIDQWPSLIGDAGVGGTGLSAVFVQGRYAYLTARLSNALLAVDVSNPAIPVVAGTAATGGGPLALAVQGRYAFTVNSTAKTLQGFDLGGAYVQQLEAGGVHAGSLATRGNLSVDGDAQVRGGLAAGGGGLYSAGAISSPRWRVSTPLPYAGAALPRSSSFTSSGGTLLVTASASGYCNASTQLGVSVVIDGTTRGTLSLTANEALSHKALVPASFSLSGLAAGSHTVSLVANANTLTDGGDFSQVVITELPF